MLHSHGLLASALADRELQSTLATLALLGLDRLLSSLPAGLPMPCEEIGALVRLISQAQQLGGADA